MSKHQPSDDVWSAPESGTVRDETSGNQPAHPQERGVERSGRPDKSDATKLKDDPCHAGEER